MSETPNYHCMPDSELPTTYLPVSDNMAESLNNLCEVVNDWATKKGWNESLDSTSFKMEQLMLMVTELAECAEFVRKKVETRCPNCKGITWLKCQSNTTKKFYFVCNNCLYELPELTVAMDDHVPSLTGESAELADVLIRIFHYCGKRGINLGQAVQKKHEYNTTRPYRHGKNC